MNGFQSGYASKSIRTRQTRSTGASMSVSVWSSNIALPKETGRLQLFRDLLDGLLNVGRLWRAGTDEFPAPEQEHDHFRHVDPVDEPGELLWFILDLLESKGDRDRVQVDLGPQVGRCDDVLDLDLRIFLDRDAGGLDLLRDDLDRLLHMFEALRPGTHDLATPEEEGRGLGLFEAVDEAGELLGLVFRAAEGERDRLEGELLPKGGRCDQVLNLDFSDHLHLRGGRRSLTETLPGLGRLGELNSPL